MDYPNSIVMQTNWYQYFRSALPLIQQIRWVNLHVLMIALIHLKEYAMDLMEPVHRAVFSFSNPGVFVVMAKL